MSWDGKSDPPVSPPKMAVLLGAVPTFFLGHFFHCSPHSWDHLPPERVMLDYYMLSVFKEMEGKEMDRLKREQTMGGNKGRPVNTTSHVGSDFFDTMNERMR